MSYFTSESVSIGHPDKICDQISDAILDAHLKGDKNSRVACEVLIKDNNIVLAGEITSNIKANYLKIVQNVLNNINIDKKFINNINLINLIGKQSQNISAGVDKENGEIGAGDQGIMFGYATRETSKMIPAPLYYSHLLMKKQAEKCRDFNFIKPDAKAQITFEYKNKKPVAIDTIIVSTQHSSDISLNELSKFVLYEMINEVIPDKYIKKDTKIFINPAGEFIIGGSVGDAGLTGRKIIVDTYGGAAPHGGGAFSGKDPTKVDRSAAYMSRYIAKWACLKYDLSKCLIQLSYSIGVPEPVSINIKTDNKELNNLIIVDILNNFDLTPKGIIKFLDLLNVKYIDTAKNGHFNGNFNWENIK